VKHKDIECNVPLENYIYYFNYKSFLWSILSVIEVQYTRLRNTLLKFNYMFLMK